VKTPLHTRIYATMAAALVTGVLLWGGPPHPRVQAQKAPVVPASAAAPRSAPAAVPPSAPVAVPVALQLRVPQVPAPADPDGIGPCPKRHSPVIWQGLDEDGRPTWKHQDGSITQRARQTIRTERGEVLEVPVILSMRPAAVGDSRGSGATPGERRSDG